MNESCVVQNSAFSLRHVYKQYISRGGVSVCALDNVSFDGPEGAITCIVGPTGSGKSTILRIVSGLEQADEGSVTVLGDDPARLAGRFGYLTQRHTLFPWMRVRDNVGLPLSLKGLSRAEMQYRVAEICAGLGLSGTEDFYPYELSGGMQQRAALGRLLASEARIWLMDEPFSALDERTRHQLQELLVELVRLRRLSVLFVTHSIDEAVFLADRVIVLSAGPGRVVETVDISMNRPRSRFLAEYGNIMERIRTRIESVL